VRDELAAEKYRALTFPTNTVIGSQAGLPALTIPVGFTEDGLPVGMELLGTPLAETKMLQFARAWESFRRPRQPPTLRPYKRDRTATLTAWADGGLSAMKRAASGRPIR
jgi:Amidase